VSLQVQERWGAEISGALTLLLEALGSPKSPPSCVSEVAQDLMEDWVLVTRLAALGWVETLQRWASRPLPS
jgi:hypothetical protein